MVHIETGAFGFHRRVSVVAGLPEGDVHVGVPLGLHVGQFDAVLRSFRSGQSGNDRAHVEFERGRVDNLPIVLSPQALLAVVLLDGRHQIFIAPGET